MKLKNALLMLAVSTCASNAATIVWDNAAPSTTQNIVTDSSVVIGNVIGAWTFTGNDTADYTTDAGDTFKALPTGTVTSGPLSL